MKIVGEKSSPNKDIEKYLGLNLKMLSCIGLDVSLENDDVIQERRILEKMPIFMTNGLGIFAAILQISLITDSMTHNRMFLATQVSSHLFSNMLCISKGYQLATAIAKLGEILREIALIWKQNPLNDEFHRNILSDAAKTLLFCKVFVVVTLCAVFGFGLPPLQNLFFQYLHARNSANHTYDYSQRVFIIEYPFPIQDVLTYSSVLLEEEYLLLASGLYWVCCDTLFAQLTTHISLQLEILQYDIETLINRESAEDRLNENFIIIVKRHRKLLSICELIESVFSPVILTTVVLSGMNICMNVFELSKTISEGNYAEAALHAFLFMNTFLQIVFYCTFAEKLTEQTSFVANSIYNCKWTEKNCKFRVYLQMLIIRSQNPFYFTAYGFFPIGHKRLTTVINTAFSYYMMLQTTS
ncbi:odorant receptor 285 [Nasonia vitripennis]|uniref:Odorant receptor n=1 Tax=Nasonia vitripennis TaxID=7425 RepID=A0A7M6UPU7_NASVI|nr:odorant receptor 285 [Nasonia vitripennis]